MFYRSNSNVEFVKIIQWSNDDIFSNPLILKRKTNQKEENL